MSGRTLLALLISSIVGMVAGTFALYLMGEPTPFGKGK